VLAASLTVGNILAMRYCLRHYRRKVMNEILGYCEHMISSQATCKPCAIKLEARIALLEAEIKATVDMSRIDRVAGIALLHPQYIDRLRALLQEDKPQ
jgi:hypothetical protein